MEAANLGGFQNCVICELRIACRQYGYYTQHYYIYSKNIRAAVRKKQSIKKDTPIADAVKSSTVATNAGTRQIEVKRPLLWLLLAAFVVYIPTLDLGFTDLDDGIFIIDQYAFNSQLGNILTTFRESVMVDVAGDIYYRPIYNISLIISTLTSGQDISGWHAMNILLHLLAVSLLYKLLLQLHIRQLHSFVLTLLFAVHPALVMAVSWMPGRTDVLLAIFAFSFLIQSINYSETGRLKALLLSGLWLLCAFFSKESGVFLLPAAFVIQVLLREQKWNKRTQITQYAIWAACFGIWFLMRKTSDAAAMNVPAAAMAKSVVERLPVLAQYMGKTMLPFDLSTYPNVKDTANYLGILSLLILVTTTLLNKKRNGRIVLAGVGMFVLLMAPLLLIPENINKQTFEYRLYLPMFGILLLLPQTTLLNNRWNDRQILTAAVGICGVFVLLNIRHQQHFSSPYAFWSNAVKTSPHDSYANMMLSAREPDTAESRRLFERAFALNPRGRYVNYIYATQLQEKGEIAASEKYLLIEKEITNYPKCDLLLARVARQKEDYKAAIRYTTAYLDRAHNDTAANLNLLILYMENDEYANALKQEKHMDSLEMGIPPIIRQQIKR